MRNRRLLIPIALVLVLCLCVACVTVVAAILYLRPQNVITTGPTSGEFSGYYSSGFEVSSFVSCDNPNEQWWLGADPATRFYDRYNALTGGPPPGNYAAVYVRFRGNLTAPGLYGHLGAYTREVYVTELLEMSVGGTC